VLKLLTFAMVDEPMEGRPTFAVSGPIENLWAIEHWINIEAVQLLVHHASAVVAAIVIFAFVARLAIWMLPHGLVRKVVVIIDDVVLILLLVYFGWDMLVYLWNRRATMQPHAAIGAAFAAVEGYLPPQLAKPLGEIARALTRLIAAPW
jgi:hypothetical protein